MIPTHWLHIGKTAIDIENCYPIRNIPLYPKPDGGIWASPLQLNSPYLSQWHEFCMNVWGKTRNQKGVVFTLKKNARIYVIDTHEDLIHLTKKTGIATEPITEQMPEFLRRSNVDFEKAVSMYDVIYLTEHGESVTRMPFINKEYELMGWDCESCLILNPHVIDKQMPISLNKEVTV